MKEDMPNEEGRQMSILVNDSNWTKLIMFAGHARKYTDRMETLIDSGMTVRFLDASGRVNALLKADSARLDDRTGDMCAFGHVTVYSPRNRRFVSSEQLCYDKEKSRLHSDSFVSMIDSLKGRTIEGHGFESDDAMTDYKIFRPSGSMNPR